MCMYIYVYVYICMCVYICVCVYIYVCVYVCIYVCKHVWICLVCLGQCMSTNFMSIQFNTTPSRFPTDPANSQGYTMEQQDKDEKWVSPEQALGKPRAPDQEGS